MKATPPLSTYGWAIGVLALLSLQFGLRAASSHPWRNAFAVATLLAVVALVVVATVAFQARSFYVAGSVLRVRTWWQPKSTEREFPLKSLASVGFTATRILGLPLVQLGFGQTELLLPVRYRGGREMAKFLFSQLGRNVQFKNAA